MLHESLLLLCLLACPPFQDDYRLPEGMKRVGYDADSGRYYFRDSNGALWEGAEGADYSEMRKSEHLMLWSKEGVLIVGFSRRSSSILGHGVGQQRRC